MTQPTRKPVWQLRLTEGDPGRQTWHPNYDPKAQHTALEHFLLTRQSNNPNHTYENPYPVFPTARQSLREGMKFLAQTQSQDGHWAGDYGGPMFLLPGFIICTYIMGIQDEFDRAYYDEMERYIKNHQNKDGGFGLHIEHHSTVFGTCLNYLSMRLLGCKADDPACVKALAYMHKKGGPFNCPQWGKFYMCALNVMDWKCCPTVPPELWMLPNWIPYVQPGKWWCHCRVVYLAMCYTYGKRAQAKVTPLILELRKELYQGQKYSTIPWGKYTHVVAESDNYYPAKWPWKILRRIVEVYEGLMPYFPPFQWIRNAGCRCALDHIKHEDKTTRFIDIGPVNKVINMLSCYFAEGLSPHTKKHIPRLLDYLWLSDDGMKFQGYNGSQLWDTSFAVQAVIEAPLAIYEDLPSVVECLTKAQQFIKDTQVLEDVDNMDKYHRHISDGAWPFSTRDHGWPISDCTAEGLKATLSIREVPFMKSHLSPDKLKKAVNVIMSMWNSGSGGWATYELTRTSPIIELLNPAALFGDIMIDYTHTECTSACYTALYQYLKHFPNDPRRDEIKKVMGRAIECLIDRQEENGGWYGFWAVCYCYGAWFALTALALDGRTYENDETVRRGCDFLVSKQMQSGGWGESYLSSELKRYTQSHRAQAINTSWVLLALDAARYPHKQVMERGYDLLLRRQMPNGNWPQESISGVFNGNCMISYSNYHIIFPIWALSRRERRLAEEKKAKK